MMEVEKVLDQLDVYDPEDRQVLREYLETEESPENINEALSKEDTALAVEIHNRIDRLIKGTFLISFLELRRQIKAGQRETADFRKKFDKEQRDNEDFRRRVLQALEQIKPDVDELKRSLGQTKRERDEAFERNKKSYEATLRIEKKLNVLLRGGESQS